MNLGLNTSRTSGRATKPLPTVVSSRPLEVAEVDAIGEREIGIKATPLQRLSARHKHIARDVANGTPTSLIAAEYGMSVSRISILKQDPTFMELVALYGAEKEVQHRQADELSVLLGVDAMSELHTRLEDEPEEFTNSELLAVYRSTLDRGGYAPKRTEQKTVTINFGDKLAEARQRSEEAAKAEAIKTIEGEVING